jgi:hypothetical protein
MFGLVETNAPDTGNYLNAPEIVEGQMACRTDRSESAEDVANAEAWAEVFKGVLYLLPGEIRASLACRE